MNESNLKPINTLAKEMQREIRSKGGKARAKKMKERKTIADALRAVLDEPIEKGSKVTKMDALAVKTIKNLYDNPSAKGLKIIVEILGELKQTINAEGITLNITSSPEGKSNIEKIMGGE